MFTLARRIALTIVFCGLYSLAFGQGSQLPKYTVATLPSATNFKSYTVQVIDGTSATDCTVGGATGTSAHNALCQSQWSGSAYVWTPVSSNGGTSSTQGTAPIKVNGDSSPHTGAVTVTCDNATNSTIGCSRPDGTTITATAGVLTGLLPASGFSMQSTTPAAGTYIKVYPTGYTASTSNPGYFATGSNTGANVGAAGSSGGGFSGNGQVVWTFTLPSYVNPANVTAVWASSTGSATTTYLSGGSTTLGYVNCLKSAGVTYTIVSNYTASSLSMAQRNIQMADTAGSDISTVTCTAQVTSGSLYQDGETVNVSAIYLQLADSIDTAPLDLTVHVAPPLYFNQALNTLGISYPLEAEIDTGAANAYVVTDVNMGLVPNQTIRFVPAHASTSTTPTLALNGSPATTIVGPTGGALTSGDMTTTQPAIVVLRPDLQWSLQNPQVSGATGSNEVATFSATPTFSTATRSSQITMTGNITSFTLAAGIDGQEKTLCFIQDGTGSWTVAAPSNVRGFFTVGATASKANCQHFTYVTGLSAWLADSAGVTNE